MSLRILLKTVFNHFCNAYNLNPTLTFNTLQILDRNSIITLTQNFNFKTQLQFIVTNDTLFNYIETNTHQSLLIKTLLRTYGGIFEHLLKINLTLISNKISITQNELLTKLQQLQKDGIIDFVFKNTDAEITFLLPREDEKSINVIAKTIDQQNELKVVQIESVLNYVNNDSDCKANQLLHYFNEEKNDPCGICSVCKTKNKKTKSISGSDLKKQIIIALEQKPLSSRELISLTSFNENEVLNTIKQLLEYQIIELTNTNTYKLKHT